MIIVSMHDHLVHECQLLWSQLRSSGQRLADCVELSVARAALALRLAQPTAAGDRPYAGRPGPRFRMFMLAKYWVIPKTKQDFVLMHPLANQWQWQWQ